MSDLAKSLAGSKEEKAPETKLAALLSSLERYGQGSATSLEKMRDDVQQLVAMVPPEVDSAAGVAARYMPGYHALASVRLGDEAARQWRDGRYGSAMNTFGDAILAPTNEVFWFMPGGGVIPKLAK